MVVQAGQVALSQCDVPDDHRRLRGSNGPQAKLWKRALQRLANETGPFAAKLVPCDVDCLGLPVGNLDPFGVEVSVGTTPSRLPNNRLEAVISAQIPRTK